MFASVGCAYALWFFGGFFGAHRFYVGRPISGLVWLFTCGLFGIGWMIDFFLVPQFVEEHNKKVFHQQMLETGSNLLFDGEYGQQQGGGYYPTPSYEPNGAFAGAVAPYSQHVYYPQNTQSGYGGGGGGGNYYYS